MKYHENMNIYEILQQKNEFFMKSYENDWKSMQIHERNGNQDKIIEIDTNNH